MSNAEVARQRLASDLFVFAPISDAFAASVSQALLSGSVVICGSWLPYTARRRAGFQYWEIDAPSQLAETLRDILRRWPQPLADCAGNPALAKAFFDSERLGKQWYAAYADAFQARHDRTHD